ncbi:MAG: ornithine carbamoyltransferase [SAR202 cluster bacterium Io17-Chloro-G2]|nr:MAG: ornithine carbamoyltransferase [SAR202 cluster bacterium Io17-Chloro-G2]
MAEKRDLVSIADLTAAENRLIIQRAREMKSDSSPRPLAGKSVALLFEKPSLRTRVSFDVAIHELGGHPIYLGPEEVGLGTRETAYDVAKVLSGYVDCIIARVYSHDQLQELAAYASVPVINALSDREHPCQIMADMVTIQEHKGGLEGLKLSFIGDGNNVARSLCLGLPALGASFTIATPRKYERYDLDEESLNLSRQRVKQEEFDSVDVVAVEDPVEAVHQADVVYTDTWISMGEESEAETRRRHFLGYTVNPALMAKANPGALFMHDMPVHYGEEVEEGMLDHPQSVAYDQAHNRLHAQKAILEFLLAGN